MTTGELVLSCLAAVLAVIVFAAAIAGGVMPCPLC